MTMEKNDVDIRKLFMWSKPITITGINGSKKLRAYMRILGDADINKARVMSLRRSAEFRKSLRTEDSDERLAFIPAQEEIDPDSIADSIIVYTMREITKRAIKESNIPAIKEPESTASTEEQEKFQQAVDEYPKKREGIIRDKMEQLINEKKAELMQKSFDDLYKLFVNALINELCEQELLQRFKEYCVFFGTFKDKELTTRLFQNFDEILNLPKGTKESLIDMYSILDLEAETLKK